jgi:peptidoglycan/LPS O-acetylase OafA/YrhL
MGQLAALDGLRSVAILLVIVAHCGNAFQAAGGGATILTRLPFVVRGWVGVDLFFVLSGFFIGRQLWRELYESGSVSVGRFILRRGLRIWPLYFTVLTLATLARHVPFWASPATWSEWLFLSNYLPGGVIMGSWSLAIEEQYYLLAPSMLWLASRLRPAWHRYGYLVAGLFLALPVVRAVVVAHHAGWEAHRAELYLYFSLHTHCDGLLMGLLLSYLRAGPGASARLAPRRVPILIAGGALLATGLTAYNRELFNFCGLAVFFGSVVGSCIFAPGPWTRWLEGRVFYTLGRLSFGMYLVHWYCVEPLAGAWSRCGLPPAVQFAGLCLSATLAAAAVAAVTFVIIEQPFLRWRDRLLVHGPFGPGGPQTGAPQELVGASP